MKTEKIIKLSYILLLSSIGFLSGCSLVGLDKQEDYTRTPHTIDPHLYKNAWEYLKSRAKTEATAPSGDKIFTQMMSAIIYSEIDSAEYMKPNRTYIFINNDAVLRGTNNDAFFRVNFVNGAPATSWSQYPKEFVKNYLLYLIIDGIYDHYTLPPIAQVTVKTFAPADSFTALPTGVTRNPTAVATFPFSPNSTSDMVLQILNNSPSNTQDYPIRINDSQNVRTNSLLATNGTIHVVERYITTSLP